MCWGWDGSVVVGVTSSASAASAAALVTRGCYARAERVCLRSTGLDHGLYHGGQLGIGGQLGLGGIGGALVTRGCYISSCRARLP